MFYFKNKNFKLSKVVGIKELPGYINQYIHHDELILAAYKTPRDHGSFTDKKILLFDYQKGFKQRKKIYSIPYHAVSAIDITFEQKKAMIHMLLENKYKVGLTFINVEPEDKVRLRLLYTCINRIISHQELEEADIKKLLENKFSF